MNEAQLHQRASEIFLAVRSLPDPQRAEAIERDAESDPRLIAEVQSLLAFDHAEPPEDDTTPSGHQVPPYDAPPSIGPYRILAPIGRGGSGRVYLAEQDTPIRRRVAIKVVPMAAGSGELAARFEVERRALEAADHPNIARVLDAGRTADGSPYLVMDLVEGVPITDFCNAKGLGVPERVGLMLKVAGAIEHVHRLGVIHRDLKPANILVAETDTGPEPKVLDFGIAKPVAGTLAEDSPQTSGLPIGTPSYMAPEQTLIGGGGKPIDTRADVYGLGAVLYELIAGHPPIEAGGDPIEVLRRIREQVPPPAGRSSEGVRASASMMADLDRILARSLEKSPERRYSGAGAWAADLARCLRCEPIEARSPTVAYRLMRFSQRNRAGVAAAIVVCFAAALAIAGLIAGRIEADRQRAIAVEHAAAQEEINRFLTEDLLGAASPNEMGGDVSALDLVRRASALVPGRFPQRPVIAASIHHTLGATFAQLGDHESAERHLSEAFQLRRASLGPDAPETVRTEIARANLLIRRQQMQEAAEASRAATDRARRILGPDDPSLYTAINDLGILLSDTGEHAEAIELLTDALKHRRRLLGDRHHAVLATASNLAIAYDNAGETRRSLAMLKEALTIAESLPAPPRFSLLGLHNNIGATYQGLGEPRAAAPHLRRAVELAEEVLSPDHPATLIIMGNLAGLESDTGDPETAAELYRGIVERTTELYGGDTPDTLNARYGMYNAVWKAGRAKEAADGFRALLPDILRVFGEGHRMDAMTRISLGVALIDAGDPRAAIDLAEHAHAILLNLYGPDNDDTVSAARLAERARTAANSRP
ncbi:MAG: serine/threonine protein kinase [Phycisphaerales bacterium]|nr:serine/threonine protein kinase [Phycisphaerales bacterium]